MAKGTARLSLGESLNIENVSEIKNKFDKKLKDGGKLVIDSKEITDLDLTGIQLLNYMMIQGHKLKMDLQFKLKLDDNHSEMIERCGFRVLSQKVFS